VKRPGRGPTCVWFRPNWADTPVGITRRGLIGAYLLPVPTRRPTRATRYARRRRRRIASKVHDLTVSQWEALQAAWGGCAYCGATGTPLQKDCVLAISRGGRYELVNVVPCCRSCNTSKCNTEVTSWMRRKKLDEARFLLRQAQINQILVVDQ
jgi:5-methylcytosine-specific restriction endonuclease McrA